MTQYQNGAIYIGTITLVFFLGLSLFTDRWGFFLWSLLPVFMVLAASFTTNNEKRKN